MKRIWRTKDGQKIKVSNMTIEHLRNAIGVLQRHHSSSVAMAYEAVGFFHGEIAISLAEAEIDRLEGGECDCGACQWIDTLKQELGRRRI